MTDAAADAGPVLDATDKAVEAGVNAALAHIQGLPGVAAKMAALEALPALEARLRTFVHEAADKAPELPPAVGVGQEIAHAVVGAAGASPLLALGLSAAVDLLPALYAEIERLLCPPEPVTHRDNADVVHDDDAPEPEPIRPATPA